jgi:hypothetical protein
MRIVIKKTLYCSTLWTLLVLPGCGNEDGLGRVRGIVKLDGEPLPDASVEFTPVNGEGMTTYGRTDSHGAYDMMATERTRGAALGKNKVSISTYDVIDNTHSILEKVPMKYNISTELECDVKSGSNKFDFDLSSEGGRVVNRQNDLSNQ